MLLSGLMDSTQVMAVYVCKTSLMMCVWFGRDKIMDNGIAEWLKLSMMTACGLLPPGSTRLCFCVKYTDVSTSLGKLIL